MVSCATVSEQPVLPVSDQVSTQIIETLQGREETVTSLKGLFQAEVEGKGMAFAHSFQGSILFQHPDHYRIKGFTRFGGLVFDFVFSKGMYALRVQDHPTPILGGRDNFQQLGELRLPVLLCLRAVEVLLGKLRLGSSDSVAIHQIDNAYQLDVPSPSHVQKAVFIQRILVEKESLLVHQLDYVNQEGKSVVSIQTSDFRQVRNGPTKGAKSLQLPYKVQAEDSVQGGSIGLEFLEIIANENLDLNLFTLTAF